jgi:hypothetical protein
VRAPSVAVYEHLLPPLQRKAVMPLLADPSRIVRMQAARTLAPLADDAFGAGRSPRSARRRRVRGGRDDSTPTARSTAPISARSSRIAAN